jgi:hypothetical protein
VGPDHNWCSACGRDDLTAPAQPGLMHAPKHVDGCAYVPLGHPCDRACAVATPTLKPLDLTLGDRHDHPDIRTDGTQYLARINNRFFCGSFSRQWYGLNFGGWVTLQYDKPGTNCSNWQAIWEIA